MASVCRYPDIINNRYGNAATGIIAGMQFWETVARVLVGVPLFLYVPGGVLDRAFLGDTLPMRGVERHGMRVFVSALLTGWLGLLLSEAGWFSFSLLALLVAALSIAASFIPRKRQAFQPRAGVDKRFGIIARHIPLSESLRAIAAPRFDNVLLGVLLVFGLLVVRPFEVVRGGLDAGVYANTGAAIARTGGIVQHDPIVADIGARAAADDKSAQHIETNVLGTQNPVRFQATRIRAAGFFASAGNLADGLVVPQFFHLWPVWLAIGISMLGPVSGLAAAGLAGALGVLFTGLIGRRAGGPVVGLLAAAFLALMTPQVWFSRMTTSEALAQALTLGGIWAMLCFAEAGTARERVWWGALAGGAFGSLALTRIDFVWAVGPVAALLVYVALTRRWDRGYTALALVLGGLLLHAGLHGLLIARAYVIDTALPTLQKYALTIYAAWPLLSPAQQEYTLQRNVVRMGDAGRLALEAGALLAVLAALLLVWRFPAPLLRVEALVRRLRRPLLGILVLVLGAGALWAYLLRPEILDAATLSDPLSPDNWLRLQGYVGAPIDLPIDRYCVEINGELKDRADNEKHCKLTELTNLANMARLGWYLSPLGIVLGTAGLLLLWWRVDRRTWLLLLVASLYTLFYINSLYGTSDATYIYILRRFVPLVLPAFAIGAAYAIAAIGGWQRAVAVAVRLEEGHAGGASAGAAVQPDKGHAGGADSRPRTRSSGSASGMSLPGSIRQIMAIGLAGALLLFWVVTGRTVYAHVEYQGALAQIDTIAQAVGIDDIVLVRGGGPSVVAVRDTNELVVAPLTYVYGRNALPIKGSQPGHYAGAFAEQVARWRQEGRRVWLLLSASGGDVVVPGFTAQPAASYMLSLREFQQLREQKPKLSYTNEVPWRLYELLPDAEAVPTTTLDADDAAAQVAGFYRSEQPESGGPRAAWTDGAAVLRLGTAANGRTVALEVAGGLRPRSIGAAELCVDVAVEPVPHPEGGVRDALPWRRLGCSALSPQAAVMSVDVPDTGGTPLLRLRSATWIPGEEEPDPGMPRSNDGRALGVRFFGATIETMNDDR